MSTLGSNRAAVTFVLTATVAALLPLQDKTLSANGPAHAGFPGWPTHYDGRALEEMPLTRRELAFVQDFPGRVGRFSDGGREIIIRWIGAPTRRLHPAGDCFRASGYSITALPARKDGKGATMGCFHASRGSEHMRICEGIHDQGGQSWPDVSSWYWHAMFGRTTSPWWSVVVAERELPRPITDANDLWTGHERWNKANRLGPTDGAPGE